MRGKGKDGQSPRAVLMFGISPTIVWRISRICFLGGGGKAEFEWLQLAFQFSVLAILGPCTSKQNKLMDPVMHLSASPCVTKRRWRGALSGGVMPTKTQIHMARSLSTELSM